MATEKVKVVNIDTDPAKKSVKDLRQELKELKDVLVSTEQGTDEYNTALQQAAEITHTLKEQTEEVNASAMDFGQIVGNCTKTIGGIVGGFQAAKAAMNLFGIENEEVVKSLQKMQSLMAITQALPSIDNGVKAFKRLKLAITAATGGVHGFKAALISTGIGAAVVAVGLLAANFDKLKSWISGTNEELEKQKQLRMEEHLQDINDKLDKRISLEKQVRKAGGQSDVEIARELVAELDKEIANRKTKLEIERRSEAAAWNAVSLAKQAGKSKLEINQLEESANRHVERRERLEQEIAQINESQLRQAREDLKLQEALEEARKIKAKQDAAAAEAERRRKDAEAARKKRIEDEKKAVEELKKKYGELAAEMKLYDASDFEKELDSLQKNEDKALEVIKNARAKGIISQKQYEADKLNIQKHYAKLREQATKDEETRKRDEELTAMDTNYQLQQALLQKQFDEQLISQKDFTDRKKELMTAYVEDYVSQIQYILDTENNLTDEQILDLTNKINEARGLLTQDTQDQNQDPNISKAQQISEAINASALALNDFSDNPAWGNILRNVATLAANWDLLHQQIQKGGKEAFTAYAQIAATALSAVAQMMNGLAAEQDTTDKEGFERAKKFQIAGATMSMLAGIASAWASSMQLMFPANVIVGSLLSAMMLTTGIMQINKIRKQQFNGGGSSGGGGSPNTGAISQVIAPVQYTQDVQGASIEGAIKDSKVYVTETDISNTQKRVEVTENEAIY